MSPVNFYGIFSRKFNYFYVYEKNNAEPFYLLATTQTNIYLYD